MVLLLAGIAFTVFVAVRRVYKFLFGSNKQYDKGYKEQWFGREPEPDDKSSQDKTIHPFKINVPDEVLTDLKERLERTRLEDPVEESRFLYGFNPNTMRDIVAYWKKDYQWRKHEEELNQFPHFKTRIEGIDVHFIHVKPSVSDGIKIIPLMMIHGWPGSIVEFVKIIPILTTPRPDRDFVFELICPSIPGYGFSESAHRSGCNGRAVARMFVTLMERLGHNKFYVQGGDWGSYISTLIARYYAPRVKGLHVNMFFVNPRTLWERVKVFLVAMFPFLVPEAEYKMFFPLKKRVKELLEESAYFHMNSTKPDTVGCGMADSPAGMAGYLLEKIPVCTNPEYLNLPDGGITKKFTLDQLLTNVMVYWVNNNATAAARFYKENMNDVMRGKHERYPVTVPSAVAVFPYEVLMMPRLLMTQQFQNMISYNLMPKGGHFAAWEEPELLSNDVYQFVSKAEKIV
ncbi:epoxide hydrolase 1-like [Uloborus diversus]|uniref:epoxide hydrolase 1-like n=1 Tax=Uloborus diversus TaxID=327109 RepID=UPI0024091457|nr:epoxide hydrolase 1-like [Uloborus diversus]